MANSDLADVWARSLDGLGDLQIQPHQRAWLKQTRPLGLVENTALIATPNEFVKEQLETRLRALITQALSQQFGRDIQLAVTVDPTSPAATPSADLARSLPRCGRRRRWRVRVSEPMAVSEPRGRSDLRRASTEIQVPRLRPRSPARPARRSRTPPGANRAS